MKKLSIILVAAVLMLTSCTAVKQLVQLKNCNYSYNSISDISVAGMDFSGEGNSSILGIASNVAKITQIISGNFSDLPLTMTVNVNVANPGTETAAIKHLKYGLTIDGLDVATGKITEPLSVAPGQTVVYAVPVSTNLGNLLNEENRATVLQIIKNFTGISSEQSTIKVKLTPSIEAGNSALTLPSIPVTFKYGKKAGGTSVDSSESTTTTTSGTTSTSSSSTTTTDSSSSTSSSSSSSSMSKTGTKIGGTTSGTSLKK